MRLLFSATLRGTKKRAIARKKAIETPLAQVIAALGILRTGD